MVSSKLAGKEPGDSSSSPDSPDPAREPASSDSSALLPPASPLEAARHSRASSASSTLTAGTLSDSEKTHSLPTDLGDVSQGVIVCLHRKMMPQESYFLSGEKYSPSLFGLPLVVSLAAGSTCQELYRQVWSQVARLVSPLPPQEQVVSNHAQDCDDSLGYEYPFVLKTVSSGGSWCSSCSWDRMCRGCPLSCSPAPLQLCSSFLAIDWDPTALHLRYLAVQERCWEEHPSVASSRKAATEPITLAKCLEAFTQEEKLGDNDKIYCSVCKTHQPCVKKLQIWRLPPILIIHLKRFQFVNSRWIKSHKIVDFPLRSLDPTNYLAAVPAATLTRHQELLKSQTVRASLRSNCATIHESTEALDSADIDIGLEEDPNDSGIESNNGHSHTLDRGGPGEVFEDEEEEEESPELRRQGGLGARKRQISTSLVKDPVQDDDLKDFHNHHLEEGRERLEVKYNMYAMVCHSGVMGGGHYVSYSKTGENKWFCHNDSACKDVPENNIDKSSAYILMYEREGLSLKGKNQYHQSCPRQCPIFRCFWRELYYILCLYGRRELALATTESCSSSASL